MLMFGKSILRSGFKKNIYFMLLVCNFVYAQNYIDTKPVINTAELNSQSNRFQNLLYEFRCLVCQNQSLAESNASFAIDLKKDILNSINKGETDKEIREYLVARYGDFIILRPAIKPITFFLWGGPVIMLLIGLFVFLKRIKAHKV